jgi:putative transposase
MVAFEAFAETYEVKYEKAVDCLTKDRAVLLAFYDFPAEHWKHLRTTNKTALAMVFKLVEAAQKSWRRLDGHNQLPKVHRRHRGRRQAGHASSPSRRLILQAVTKIRR